MDGIWKHWEVLRREGTPFSCVTLVAGQGSSPAPPGARILVTAAGLHAGTVGGGKVEAHAISLARRALQIGSGPTLHACNLQKDLGMTCGGVVQLFVEVFNSVVWPITIYGAGHICQTLVPLLLPLNCHITCVDQRQQWLDRLPQAPNLRPICHVHPEETVGLLSPQSFVLLMTMGHATDLPILREILQRHEEAPFPYVGMVGSKTKAAAMRSTLAREGFSAAQCRAFHCPIGLPIGGNHLQEIAISIAAQLLLERDALPARVTSKAKTALRALRGPANCRDRWNNRMG